MVNTAELQIIVLVGVAPERARAEPAQALAPEVSGLRSLLSRAGAVAGHAVTVVLGARAADIAPALGRLPVSLVVNQEWREGDAAAVRAGVASVAGSCAAVLLLRSDQAGVSSADLQRLMDVWRRTPRSIVAAQYEGHYGLPAVVPRAEFPALLRLRGAQGADALLRNPAVPLTGVPMPGAAPPEEEASVPTGT